MNELAYVLITPYALLKSRTGGILARILSNTDLELRAVSMFAPSDSMVDEYISALWQDKQSKEIKDLFSRYVEQNLRAENPSQISNRCVFLLFEGEDAANAIKRAAGFVTARSYGDTVRVTYGDYITHGETIVYFEPAVLCAPSSDAARSHLKVFKKYARTDSGVITRALPKCEIRNDCQTTLVMVKPDNFGKKSTRPGNIIDMFSRTGLYIVGAKLVRFSVAQAQEFYKPLKKIFEKKLEQTVSDQLEAILDRGLPFPVYANDVAAFARRLRKNNALYQFNQIIEYISGLDPALVPPSEYARPGKERCLVLLYYGEDAVSKIRQVLGATDPSEAVEGTVRSEFGHDVLKNGVHASDSPKNALRESKIVGLVGCGDSEMEKLIPY
jgi:nucleoside diphosphate kinase